MRGRREKERRMIRGRGRGRRWKKERRREVRKRGE